MADYDDRKNVKPTEGPANINALASLHLLLQEPDIVGVLPGLPAGLLQASALDDPLIVDVAAWVNLPPKNAIDKLSFQWRRQNTSNAFNTMQTYDVVGPLADSDFPMSFSIDAGKLDYEEGPFDFRYVVVGHNGGGESESNIVPLVIDRTPPYKHLKPSTLILPATQITIPFFEAHDNKFVCVIPEYADYQDGDEVVYFWRTRTGSQLIGRTPVATNREIIYTRAQIEAALNGECYAEYQLIDKAGNSSPLSESVPIEVDMAPRSLGYVKVTGASGSSQFGKLNIDSVGEGPGDGITVNIPPESDIYEGEKVLLQWADPLAFNAITLSSADPDAPLLFNVPRKNIAAHMVSSLADGARYIPVYYEVLDGSSSEVLATSGIYGLTLSDILATNYPTMQCSHVNGNILSLSSVPVSGAEVSIGVWPFMADDQYIKFKLVGLGQDDKNLEVPFFEHKVTAEEVADKKVSVAVAKEQFLKFKVGIDIYFEGQVTFNNKGYWYGFRALRANLTN